MSPFSLFRGREFQQSTAAAAALIFEQPDGAVGTLFHFANASAHVEALRLGAPSPVNFTRTSDLRRQAADESIAIPLRETSCPSR